MTWIVKHNAPRRLIPRDSSVQPLGLRQRGRPVHEDLRARGFDAGQAGAQALDRVRASRRKGDGR